MSDYTKPQNYLSLAEQSTDHWFKNRALRRAAEEITRLQSEVERLRGREAELEEGLRSITSYPDVREYVGTICHDAALSALGGTSDAWLLRKQAEAIDVVIKRIREARHEVDRTSVEESDTACTLRVAESIAISEAQRLRDQADEIGRGQE